MSDNTHAAMCVYCGESIIYDTREVTDMAAAHAQIIEHDQQCPKNPMVDRLAFLNQQNTTLQEQCDEYRDHLAVIAEMTGNKGDIGAAHEGVNAVIEERDALAAHLESLTSLWTELGYSMADGNDDAGQLWQALENLFASKSAASLARRDSLKQREAVMEMANDLAHEFNDKQLEIIRKRAERLGQQAEVHQ